MPDSPRELGGALRRAFRRFTRAAWWVHVLATLVAVALLLVVGAAVLAVLYVDYVRERGPIASEVPLQSQPSDEERTELARRFAPVLRYDSRELFGPISREAYVSRTQLKEQEGRFLRVVNAKPTVDDLPPEPGLCTRIRNCSYFLDVRGVEPDPPKDTEGAYAPIERQLLREGFEPTVYAHVTRYDSSGEYAVQYWFLYLFNFRLNEHESDWEQVTVHLDADRNPVGAFYSSHEGGNVRRWEEAEREGEHPVVYPALGSHANYFRSGRHPVHVACRRVVGSISRCLRGRRVLVDLADGQGRTFEPTDYDLTELSGPVFIGSYGTGNYVVLTRRPSVLSDPRLRRLWLDPLRPLR